MLARSPNSETMVGKDCSVVIDGEVISVLLALDGDQTRSSTTATRDLNLDELYRLSSMESAWSPAQHCIARGFI